MNAGSETTHERIPDSRSAPGGMAGVSLPPHKRLHRSGAERPATTGKQSRQGAGGVPHGALPLPVGAGAHSRRDRKKGLKMSFGKPLDI